MAGRKYFSFDGLPLSGAEIKSKVKDAFEEEAEKVVEVLVRDTENLLKKMQANSANRGRGIHADEYNDPLSDAEVEVVELGDGHFHIVVNNPIFHLIDEGRPAISKFSGKPMRFPVYEGTMTEPNSLAISQAHVEEMPKWVSTRVVGEVKPRHLLQQIVDKKTYLRPPERSRRTRNPFRWRFSKDEVSVTVNSDDDT